LNTQPELKRQIGIRTATALVVGQVIAVGIFLTPAGMAKLLGSPLWVLLVWLVMGAMAVCGALCYGEMAAQFPQAGGSYVYLREAYGRPIAFLYGWMALLVMAPGLTAALAVGMAGYAAYVFSLSPAGTKAVAIAAIVLLAAINVRGLKLGAWLMRWLTILKLGLLLFLLLWGFGFQLGSWSNFTPFVMQRPHSPPLLSALAGGMVAAFFSFGGWWDVTKLAGEVREPGRTLPRALLYGVLIVTLVYRSYRGCVVCAASKTIRQTRIPNPRLSGHADRVSAAGWVVTFSSWNQQSQTIIVRRGGGGPGHSGILPPIRSQRRDIKEIGAGSVW